MSAVSISGSAMHADAISMPATAATVEGSSSLPSSAVTVSSVGEATATDTGFHAERPPVKATSSTATSPDSSALFSSFTVKLCLAALAKTWVSTMSRAFEPSSNDAHFSSGLR